MKWCPLARPLARPPARPPGGFSFVEVMAAVVILSISLIVLMENQTRSMEMLGRARTADYATTLAIAKMTELTQAVRQKGFVALRDEESGEFDQEKYPTYRWRYWLLAVPPPDFGALLSAGSGGEEEGNADVANSNAALLGGPLQAITKVWGNALKELHVEVSWGEGTTPRTYELATQLIASDAVSQLTLAVTAMTAAFGGGRGGP